MKIKPYEQKYFLQLRNLRNSREVAENSNHYSVSGIDLMYDLENNDYRVAVENGVLLGYVGVRGKDNEVSIAVNNKHYRRGIASKLLESVIKDYPFLTAEVLYDNEPSHELFKKKGFERVKTVYEYGDGGRGE